MTLSQPITRTDLARLTGVTTQTLRNWQLAGLIPAPRRVSGRRVEFDPAEATAIAALAESRR